MVNYSFLYFAIFALFFGIYGYYCLGDNYTTDLFILRRAYEGKKYEIVYRVILFLTIIGNLAYMPFFNLGLRTTITQIIGESNFIYISLIPFYVSIIISIVYPDIMNFLGYNGVFVIMINGFILPTLMYIKML